MNIVNTKKDMIALAKHLGVRDDWHEPDEQAVEAVIEGDHFDNAGYPDEMAVVIVQGMNTYRINVCDLLAWASK